MSVTQVFYRNLRLLGLEEVFFGTYPVNTTVWVSLTLVLLSTTRAAPRSQGAFSRQAASSPAMESEREEPEEDGERRRREHESEHESDGGAERRVAQASAQRASGSAQAQQHPAWRSARAQAASAGRRSEWRSATSPSTNIVHTVPVETVVPLMTSIHGDSSLHSRPPSRRRIHAQKILPKKGFAEFDDRTTHAWDRLEPIPSTPNTQLHMFIVWGNH